MKIIPNFFKPISVIILLVSLILGNLHIISLANSEAQIKNEYEANKLQIQNQLTTINSQLEELGTKYQNNQLEQTNLVAQSSQIKKEISEIDKLIMDTKIVISQVEKQMQVQQKEIDNIKASIKELNLEVQSYGLTPKMKIFFSGQNLGEILSQAYKISSLKDRITKAEKEAEEKQKVLSETKQQNEQIKSQLEKSKGLIKSRQSSYESMLSYSSAKNGDLEKLILAMKEQRKQLDAQIDGLSGDYLSEIDSLKDAENRKNIVQTNCSFEENSNLLFPKDFFNKPTSGWVTQPFHCGHDGVDIANSLGTDIYAVADGVVAKVGPKMDGCVGFGCSGGFGNYLVILHTLPSGEQLYSLYGHLYHQPPVSVGQKVNKGQVIAQMGCSGYTLPFPCGVHLHFMLIAYSIDKYGLGCRLGKNKCYNPANYINPLS